MMHYVYLIGLSCDDDKSIHTLRLTELFETFLTVLPKNTVKMDADV